MENEKIWFNDFSVLFEKNKIMTFIPEQNMSYNEKINSITRFSLFLSIILYVVLQNYLYLYIFLIVVGVTYMMFIFNRESFFNINNEKIINNVNNSNNLNNENNGNNGNNGSNENEILNQTLEDEINNYISVPCQEPSDQNPLMNLMVGDDYKNKKVACSLNNNNIKEKVDDYFKDRLFNDTATIYNSRNNQRQFYTMPNTKAPNDQGAFANWLYNTPVSCALGDHALLKQTRTCSYNFKPLKELKEEL